MRKLVQWTLLFIITYASVELFSYGGLYLLEKYRHVKYEPVDVLSQKHSNIIKRFIEKETTYIVFSSTLGWSIKKNGYSELYQSNSNGIRSDRDHALTPPYGVRRVSTFGDSFTHCDDVDNNNTWQAIMEGYNSNLEVLNFGVGGYGLDQAYLRYLEDGYQYKSHITLIGFMSENIYRNVNTFRPFYNRKTEIPLAKPRFLVVDNKLAIVPNYFNEIHQYDKLLKCTHEVLGKLGINDYFFKSGYCSSIFDWSPTDRIIKILINKASNRLNNDIIMNGYYNKNSEAFIVTKRLFDVFRRDIISNNSIPIIVIFPSKDDVIRYQTYKTKRYDPLLSYFDSMSYRYIDLIDAYENVEIEGLMKNHYSPAGNRLIAEHIYNYLTYISS